MMCVICEQRDEPCWRHGEECRHLVFRVIRLREKDHKVCVSCKTVL
jgi:hypothetical protein